MRTARLDSHYDALLRAQRVARHARFRDVLCQLNSDGSLASRLAELCQALQRFFHGPHGRVLTESVSDPARASALRSLSRHGGVLTCCRGPGSGRTRCIARQPGQSSPPAMACQTEVWQQAVLGRPVYPDRQRVP